MRFLEIFLAEQLFGHSNSHCGKILSKAYSQLIAEYCFKTYHDLLLTFKMTNHKSWRDYSKRSKVVGKVQSTLSYSKAGKIWMQTTFLQLHGCVMTKTQCQLISSAKPKMGCLKYQNEMMVSMVIVLKSTMRKPKSRCLSQSTVWIRIISALSSRKTEKQNFSFSVHFLIMKESVLWSAN